MKFQCSNCGHTGAADDVRSTEEGVEVVCAECGTAEPLETRGDAENEGGEGASPPSSVSATGVGPDTEEALEAFGPEPDDDRSAPLAGVVEEPTENLIPDPGEGPRCPKCAALVSEAAEHCPRCGLDLAEGRSYDDGEAPWEEPPRGKEGERRRALELWEAFEDEPGAERLETFVEFARDEQLVELGVRRLRFYLAENPDDREAADAVASLVEEMNSRVAAAKARAEADAEQFDEDIARIKRALAWIVILLSVAVVLLGIQFLGGR
ncbi:MAG: zinc ribbon domain-containing protein [Bradymonadaceae bacterium]